MVLLKWQVLTVWWAHIGANSLSVGAWRSLRVGRVGPIQNGLLKRGLLGHGALPLWLQLLTKKLFDYYRVNLPLFLSCLRVDLLIGLITHKITLRLVSKCSYRPWTLDHLALSLVVHVRVDNYLLNGICDSTEDLSFLWEGRLNTKWIFWLICFLLGRRCGFGTVASCLLLLLESPHGVLLISFASTHDLIVLFLAGRLLLDDDLNGLPLTISACRVLLLLLGLDNIWGVDGDLSVATFDFSGQASRISDDEIIDVVFVDDVGYMLGRILKFLFRINRWVHFLFLVTCTQLLWLMLLIIRWWCAQIFYF